MASSALLTAAHVVLLVALWVGPPPSPLLPAGHEPAAEATRGGVAAPWTADGDSPLLALSGDALLAALVSRSVAAADTKKVK